MSIATSAAFEVLRNNPSSRKANGDSSNLSGDSAAGSIVLSGAEMAKEKFIAIPRPVRDQIQTNRKRKMKTSDAVVEPLKKTGNVSERACLQANGVSARAVITRACVLSRKVDPRTESEVDSSESRLVAVRKTRRGNERTSKFKRTAKPKALGAKATDTCRKVNSHELVADENRFPLIRTTQCRKAATKTMFAKEYKASASVIPSSVSSCHNSSIQLLRIQAARDLRHHQELLKYTKSSLEKIRRQEERARTGMNPQWNDCVPKRENGSSSEATLRPSVGTEASYCKDGGSAVSKQISHVSRINEEGTRGCKHKTRQKAGKQIHLQGQTRTRVSRKSVVARVKTYRSRSYVDSRNIGWRRKITNGRSVDGSVIEKNYKGFLWKPTCDPGLVVTTEANNTCNSGCGKYVNEANKRAVSPIKTRERKFRVGNAEASSVWKGEKDNSKTGGKNKKAGSEDPRNKHEMCGPRNGAPMNMDVTSSMRTISAHNVNDTQQRLAGLSMKDAQNKAVVECLLDKKNLSNIEDALMVQLSLEANDAADDQSTEHQATTQESLRNESVQDSGSSANKTMMRGENEMRKDAKIEENRSIMQFCSKCVDVRDKAQNKGVLQQCLENGWKQRNQNAQSKATMQYYSEERSTGNEGVTDSNARVRDQRGVTVGTAGKGSVCAKTNGEMVTKNLKDEWEDSLFDLDFLARQRRSATGDFKVNDLPVAEVISVGHVQPTVDESVRGKPSVLKCEGASSNVNLHEQPDDTWSQLNTLASICGCKIETQTRAGFTGRKADIFLFEFYIHLGNNVFTGFGASLEEAREQCALPAVQYLKERFLQDQATFKRMLKLQIASSHVKPMSTAFVRNNRTSGSYVSQSDEVTTCLSNSLHAVLTRIKKYQIKCDCNQALRNLIQLLLRAIHRLSKTDKRIIAVVPVGQTHRILSKAIPCKRCLGRTKKVAMCIKENGAAGSRTEMPDHHQTLLEILILSTHWPTLDYAEQVTSNIKSLLPWFHIRVPQIVEDPYIAAKVQKANDPLFPNRDSRGIPDLTIVGNENGNDLEWQRPLIEKYAMGKKDRYCFSLFFLQNQCGNVDSLQNDSRGHQSWSKASLFHTKERHSRGIESWFSRNGHETIESSALDQRRAQRMQLPCKSADELLTRLRVFEKRIRQNRSALDAFRLLSHLCDIYLLLKEGDDEEMDEMHAKKAVTTGCGELRGNFTIDDTCPEKISCVELEFLIDYWLNVRPDACLEWLFQRCLQSLAYGDVIPTCLSNDRPNPRDEALITTASQAETFYGPQPPDVPPMNQNDILSAALPAISEQCKANTTNTVTNSNNCGPFPEVSLRGPIFANAQEMALHCCLLISTGCAFDIFNSQVYSSSAVSSRKLSNGCVPTNVASASQRLVVGSDVRNA